MAKLRNNPLIEQGHRVFIAYDSKAFETRTHTSHGGWVYTTSRNPTPEFLEWMAQTAGPRDILWTVQKKRGDEGLNIFFFKASHAMLCKLTWGGV